MTGVILQVRLDSSRMPGKALLTIGGRTVVEHVMMRLNRVETDAHVLACDEASFDILAPFARKAGFTLFAGSKDDVLSRFVAAAESMRITTVVRATGDNPLVAPEFASLSLEAHVRDGADHTIVTGLPIGTGVEIVETSALVRANSESDSAYDHEHVTPYIYSHSELFRLKRIPSELGNQAAGARVTLDTPSDYRRLLRIFRDTGEGVDLPSFETLRLWLEAHPTEETSS